MNKEPLSEAGRPTEAALPVVYWRGLRWRAGLAWLGALLALGLVWVEDWFGVLHPQTLLLTAVIPRPGPRKSRQPPRTSTAMRRSDAELLRVPLTGRFEC